jgi:hypothetical protein
MVADSGTSSPDQSSSDDAFMAQDMLGRDMSQDQGAPRQDLGDMEPDLAMPSMDMAMELDMQGMPDLIDMSVAPDPREGPGVFAAVGWRETLATVDSQGQVLSERHLSDEEQYDKSLLIRTVSWGPQGFVALGDRLIYWSLDGLEWATSEKPEGSGWMSGSVYGAGRYVSAGGTGAMWSDDGRTWQSVQVMRGIAIRDMTYGNGVFVAVGDKGFRATSSDGEAWSVHHAPVEGEPGLNGVAFGAGQFLAVGGAGVRMTSTDGVTWQDEVLWEEPERTMSEEARLSLAGAVYAGNQWVVVGRKYLYTSPDATPESWAAHPTNTYFTSVTYGGGQYVATAGSVMWSSVDGASWTMLATPQGSGFWDVAFKPDVIMP